MKNKKRRTRCLTSVFCIATILLAVAARIYCVNAFAEHVPDKRYSTGEWVNQGDGYLVDRLSEEADGYAFKINGAEILTPNQYLEKYSRDGVKRLNTPDAQRKSVVVVDMTIKNKTNLGGGVAGYLWYVVPGTLNDYYQLDTELFSHAEPEVGDGGQFSVAKGYAHRTHLAFTNLANDGFFSSVDAVSRQPINSKAFHLRVSARPERKIIDFAIDKA